MSPDTRKGLENLAGALDWHAESYRALADHPDATPELRAVLAAASVVFGALAMAVGECAGEGHTAPVESLAHECQQWVEATALFEVAEPVT